MIRPSKELLAEVLGYLVTNVSLVRNNHINITGATEKYTPATVSYNIYELEQKCKEYIINNNYSLHITHDTSGLDCRVIICKRSVKEYFHENTEPEAIFKACEWILKETKNDSR